MVVLKAQQLTYSMNKRKQRQMARQSAPKGLFSFVQADPRTEKQAEYIESIKQNDLVFGLGSAGTGKTFLAVNMGLKLLSIKKVKKLYIVRPAVESGEKIGTLPGNIDEKLHPYLIPIYDSISKSQTSLERIRPFVEIAPLAYMRGRTLEDCVVILDEAQNTSPQQMLMFLTRLGENCKAIVTGDPAQTDIHKENGLVYAASRLVGLPNIGVIKFTDEDIVRSRLVVSVLGHWNTEPLWDPTSVEEPPIFDEGDEESQEDYEEVAGQ